MDKSNREFAGKLEKRTKDFALMIINIASQLPNNAVGNIIRYQVIKSGTSIGANYREANRSVSLADFKNKIGICVKEASETQYWLEIIMETKLIVGDEIQHIHKECSELLALFTSIARKRK